MVAFNCFWITAIVSLAVYLGLDWYSSTKDERKDDTDVSED